MSRRVRLGVTGFAVAIGFACFAGCIGSEDSTPNGQGNDGGSGGDGSSDGAAADGASNGDGPIGCGTCSVPCNGDKCPTAPVQLTSWCANFQDSADGGAGTDDSTCALLQSGDVYCWGYNGSGELGVGDQNNRLTATKIATDIDGNPFSAVEIAMGVSHACARKADGSIWCWGHNNSGECGQLASATPILKPTRVGSLGAYKHIFAGGYFTCGIDGSDQVTCWGANDQDALGNTGGNTQNATTIAFMSGNLTTSNMAIGDQGGCAQVVDNAYCWGTDRSMMLGELGQGVPSPSPVDIGDPSGTQQLENVAGLEYGRYTAFTILTSQQVLGWGDNDYGELGFSQQLTDNVRDPRYFGGGLDPDAGVSDVDQVSAGLVHTCVRKHDGSILCAGANSLLQLGTQPDVTDTCTSTDSTDLNLGIMLCATTPVPLTTFAGPAVVGATDVVAGCGITCFTGSDRKVYCEGNDTIGATGRNTMSGDMACDFGSIIGLKCAGTPAPVQGLP